MDELQYRTLLAAVADTSDPRHTRGNQHAWRVILTLLTVTLVSGQCNGHAMER